MGITKADETRLITVPMVQYQCLSCDELFSFWHDFTFDLDWLTDEDAFNPHSVCDCGGEIVLVRQYDVQYSILARQSRTGAGSDRE
jgi:hypothetical protein